MIAGAHASLAGSGLAGCLAGLAALALAGRVLLAWLPAGEPWSHAPRALATTWAASHLLGLAGAAAVDGIAGLLGLDPGFWGLAWPWIALAVVRVASLPSALRPRHEVPAEVPGALARWTLLALALVVLLPSLELVFREDDSSLAPLDALQSASLAWMTAFGASRGQALLGLSAASLAAMIALLAHGLAQARRAPLGRRLVLLVLALTPYVQRCAASDGGELAAPLLFGAGCAFLVPWLRRADARAAALAAISFAACPLAGAWPLGLAGAIVLLASTHRAGVRMPASFCLGAFLVLDVPWLERAWIAGAEHADAAASFADRFAAAFGPMAASVGRIELWGLGWWAALVGIAIALWWVTRKSHPWSRGPGDPDGGVDPPLREVRALSWLLFLAALAQAASVGFHQGDATAYAHARADELLLQLAPCAALICGLALVRDERPR